VLSETILVLFQVKTDCMGTVKPRNRESSPKNVKSYILWDITPRGPLEVKRRFGRICRLQFQGQRIIHALFYIPEARTVPNHRFENLKSYKQEISYMRTSSKRNLKCTATETGSIFYQPDYIKLLWFSYNFVNKFIFKI
jgi:hypothetical protein